jgi:hypothetical protein
VKLALPPPPVGVLDPFSSFSVKVGPLKPIYLNPAGGFGNVVKSVSVNNILLIGHLIFFIMYILKIEMNKIILSK